MTTSSIGPSAGLYSAQSLALDAEGQLAVLLLETQEAEQEVDRDHLALARSRFVEASDAQVEAMRDEADHILIGAAFKAGAGLTAAGIQVGDVLMPAECDASGKLLDEKPWGEICAGGASGLSAPLGSALGDAPAADARADAKRAGTSAQQSEWQLSDAKDAIARSDEQQDKVTEWLRSQATGEANASAAIIAGIA